ncbi:MAG: carbamoyltransferase [Deltaproteobacteria bacterium]|nr:carbamoyltransferase [Deltaproteobacteria bacterium]
MYILGIHDGHCSSACLLSDERLVAWVQEERFTRQKNDIDFPAKAIQYCLDAAGIEGKDLDAVALATRSFDPSVYRIKRETSFSIDDWLREQNEFWYPLFYENRVVDDFYSRLAREKKFSNLKTYYPLGRIAPDLPAVERCQAFRKVRKDFTAAFLGIDSDKIKVIDHHTCHAMYACYASSLQGERIAVLTNDGGGDATNGTVWLKEKGQPLKEIARNNCSNLGRIYRYITLLLGMKIGEHEFKVMGLAPYATDREVDKSWHIFQDLFSVENNLIVPQQRTKDLFFHFKDALLGHRFDGIAGAAQRMVEEVTRDWFQAVAQNFDTSHFVYSGGVAMNVKLNGQLASQSFVDALHVPPSGGDESVSLGAAYAVMEEFFLKNGRAMDGIPAIQSIYLGPDIPDSQYRDACHNALQNNDFAVLENVSPRQVANFLAQGNIIARCAGRMEFGQRALGNRSIFADPRSPEIIDKINTKIKYRDFWMPFAPMVLAEHLKEYFNLGAEVDTRYMMVAVPSTAEGRKTIPAGLHPSDKTGRPQTMSADLNKDVTEMLTSFKDITGVGGILNTSFNIHGEPIVCSAEDALHTMRSCDLDGVWINDVLIHRVGRI